jgi:hypothetical protein
MRIRSVGALWFGLTFVLVPAARAQAGLSPSLARVAAAADSSTPARRSWSGTGAIVGGVGGGVAFAVAFYHFTHRTGAINNATGTLGGTVVGAAIGAASGALFGALVGSLFPRHRE